MNPHLIRARLLMDQRRWEMALAEFQGALAEEPRDPGTHCGMTMALLRLNRWNEARRAVDAALEHGPEDPEVHWMRAIVFLERDQLAGAEEAIRTAIKLDPDDADLHGLLARILYEGKKFDESLASADAGLAVDATNDLSLTYRARTLSSLGRHDEAGEVTEALLREDPLDSWNHCVRGEDLLLKGRADEARVHFLESLRLQPGNDAARAGFAVALKAQSPVYGSILAVLVRMGRLKSQNLWLGLAVMLGLFQIIPRLVSDSPAGIVAFAAVKEFVYSGFILLFLGNPMFDLIMRLHPEGRHVLSPGERRATNWYLICFALAGLCALWALGAPKAVMARFYGYAMLFLCIPVREIFETESPCVRKWMAGLTIGLGGLLLLTPLLGPVGLYLSLASKQASLARAFLGYLLWMPLVVILFSAFGGYIRRWFEKRRPD